jgi:hypothetical protein
LSSRTEILRRLDERKKDWILRKRPIRLLIGFLGELQAPQKEFMRRFTSTPIKTSRRTGDEGHNWFHVFVFEERNLRINTISLKRHCKYLVKESKCPQKNWGLGERKGKKRREDEKRPT